MEGHSRKGIQVDPGERVTESQSLASPLMAGEGEKLTRKAIELAQGGDTVALRLCLERIYPVRKGRLINLEIRLWAGLTFVLFFTEETEIRWIQFPRVL